MVTEKTEKTNKAKPAGTILGGRYELKGVVGRGGFSIVYEATDLKSGEKVAVKECTVLSEKERFLREAKMLADYAGENAIVRVIGYFEDEETAYIVMEFLEGENLRECIEHSGRWTMEEAVQRMAPVMETLGHMHSNNVIHRDISPDNIMVLEDGSLKLLDFGAAKQYEDSTLSRLVVKASYSPPEQMDAKGVFGSWSDVYSICAAMYFCITGKNPEDAISRLMIDDLKKPSELGADILPAAEKTLMRGMALDSKERIHDIDLLRKELEKVYPILSEEEKLEIKKKKQRRRTAALSAAAALIVLVLSVIYVNRHSIPLYGAQKEAFFMEFYSRMSEQDRSNAMDEAEAAIGAFSEDNYYIKEDGDRVRFEIPEKAFEDNDPLEEIRKFFADTVGANVSVYPAEPEDRVEWEAGGSDGAGAFQKDPGDIKGDTFWLVSYDISEPYDRDGGEGWRKAMAKRLDALQIPYAAGVDRYDFRKMWYCIPRSEDAVMNIGPEVLTLIGEKTVSSIGGLRENEIIDDTGELITDEKSGSGEPELAYRIKDRRIEEAKLLLERLKAEGDEYIYLYINGTIVAKADVSRAYITDNTISFDSWYSDSDITIDDSTLNLANCLVALTTTDATPGAPLTDCYILGYRDGYNKPEGKDYKPTFGPATGLFDAAGGLRGDRDKNDDLEVITDTENRTVDAVYWCDENTTDEEILKRFRNFMTVFDKLLVDGWIKQINFKVMRGGDNSTPDVAMMLDFNGTALRYTADYMDDDNSREFFEQDSYFAEFSEDSETLDEFRKDGWEDIDVSEIPERDDLNTFLYWYVLFGGSMGRVYNCLDPVNSYWETEVINLMDRIPYRTNYARQYSPEEKSDPRGWSEKEHFGWISINKKDEDWVLKNIFNCTDDQITAMIVEGESKKRIYQDGDQYCLCSLRSGVGISGEEITSAKTDGKYYLIKYAVGTPAGEPEEGKLKDGSSGRETYYALLKLKEIEGEKYWSLFYDGQMLPADIDTLCQHDPS